MSAHVPAAVRREVRERAGGRCEFCRIDERLETRLLQVDHVRPLRHGGRTTPDNLALACSFCNHWKGPNLTTFDPVEDRLAALFDPRADVWTDHFEARAGTVSGLTPTGRATVAFLKMNQPARLRLRAASFRLAGATSPRD